MASTPKTPEPAQPESAQPENVESVAALLNNLRTPQNPQESEPSPQKPARLTSSCFLKGLYCSYKEHPHEKYLEPCRILAIAGGAGLIATATVQPSRIGTLVPREPVTVQKQYVKYCTCKIGDRVHVLDDRSLIPDQHNEYWYNATVEKVIDNRRDLPDYIVKPVDVPAESQTVPAWKVRRASHWLIGNYWSKGPDGPTKSEADRMKDLEKSKQKNDALEEAKKQEALAKGQNLADLMELPDKHKLLLSQMSTPGTPPGTPPPKKKERGKKAGAPKLSKLSAVYRRTRRNPTIYSSDHYGQGIQHPQTVSGGERTRKK